jgi:hypothetical protein
MPANVRMGFAVDFLSAAVAHDAALGMKIKRLLTDNGGNIAPRCSNKLVGR